MFPHHTIESAPAASRRALQATTDRLGFLPSPVALLATSPQALEGFLKLSALFESTTLDQLDRETLILTIAARNACEFCVAMHTQKLTAMQADPALIAALRAQQSLPDAKLEELRLFTLEVLATAGGVADARVQQFLDHGYTARNALEIVLGISTYTLSTFANRLTGAPLNDQLKAFA
ncbi:carboxymuconolactone decarboxylase family protein [Streptomyces sp. NBC_01387]|uniref:carboxymuconolactone decarboxylase family protein n=1 Tax=unclassified Streptomyces TaxID=2593676 RepID=UPI002025117D|nr:MULTISPECIES: carboxymuconolactone decarboxylase family protein [unclassified Streptomyces]MCX4549080.1 carboxymuconolactone decarboxylase family protein [Streptomyces sp. NBC_01500]WSC20657.1 carboxymuconolactone decarboxylase family protein [Streptomyces sp. NBC_01766]WSV54686.1 carboxymuconolactone decarboxylase family protein [Streptomyces sp. NBC_01014]